MVEYCKHNVPTYVRCRKCQIEKDNANLGIAKSAEPLPVPPPGPMVVPGYQELARVLTDAFDQSARGKGKERHANDKPFSGQPIMEIARMIGVGGHAYQVMKKTQEAVGMANRDECEKAIHEMRGAIVYCAAMILILEEMKNDR